MKIGSAIAFLVLALVALGFLLSDNLNTREKLIQLENHNQQLTQQILTIQTELESANQSITEYEQKINQLSQQTLSQQEQIQRLSIENTELKEQNVLLQNQTEALQFFRSIRASFPRSLSFLLFLPIIPASMAATYMFVRYNKKHIHKNPKPANQRKTPVQLTDEEIKQIINLRRHSKQ